MANYKLVPNQKEVKVNKEPCNKSNLYATINLQAMEAAARALDAAAFKLWIYFSKNQNGYQFALSSKDVLDTFGMKRDQYNGAIEKLIKGGYLVQVEGSKYTFNEVAVVGNSNNEIPLQENPTTMLQEIPTTMLQEIPTRNIIDNTKDTIQGNFSPTGCREVTIEPPKAEARVKSKQEKIELWRF